MSRAEGTAFLGRGNERRSEFLVSSEFNQIDRSGATQVFLQPLIDQQTRHQNQQREEQRQRAARRDGPKR